MARRSHDRDFASILSAAQRWLTACWIGDGSLFATGPLWTPGHLQRLHEAFVGHPDPSDDDFLTKFRRQLQGEPEPVRHVAAELLWGMYLFPANIGHDTKRSKIRAVWGDPELPAAHELLTASVLDGIGSSGPGYNTHFPREVAYAITLAIALKQQPEAERRRIISDYDAFTSLMDEVRSEAYPQFRHMLRFFAFPDRVERIASGREMVAILVGFGAGTKKAVNAWSIPQIDEGLLALRRRLAPEYQAGAFDFYAPGIYERWQAPTSSAPDTRVAAPAAAYAPETAGSHPLNQILYGPPGTGKTWTAMRLAIEICTGERIDGLDNAEVTRRFTALRADDRVALVTFHQSTSYEDFVEGLRPVTRPDGSLAYEVKPGLFRVMCERARAPEAKDDLALDERPVWKMSLGDRNDDADADIYPQCIERGLVALGYGRGLDFSGCDDRDAVLARLREVDREIEASDYDVVSVHAFKNRMRTGDLVVVSNGNLRFRAIGRVAGPYQPPKGSRSGSGRESVERWQTRRVEWRWIADGAGSPYQELTSKRFSQQSIYQMSAAEIDPAALRRLVEGRPAPAHANHVMIIDEINRGNVARILGELITCIEPQRRLGQAEETRVQLTYSQHLFGVPANLYLIGTMNTADRSIAFLDSALRRRFRFVNVPPEPDLVEEVVGIVGGVDVAAVLRGLNQRLAVLLSEDHQLGHAHFLGIRTAEDLRLVLLDQVIPLLREHFHGDDGRWCQALACGFDPESGQQTNPQPVLLAERVALGEGEDRLRVRINPAFLAASGENLRAFLDRLAGA